jgi:hypothetical protein
MKLSFHGLIQLAEQLEQMEQPPVAIKECTGKQTMSQRLHELTCNNLHPGRMQLSVSYGTSKQ